ncbi:hypothetical protein PRZ48_011163 [Zasmidium cellare]|uniref:Tubulin-specific chaperone A n=1 Tax=Zasmidium cellare TaxID=395010 RepID=A0ABR0EB50_ZASCE|nr:hypothetical protein PRZ48_011163 [Zasmidium cellare]
MAYIQTKEGRELLLEARIPYKRRDLEKARSEVASLRIQLKIAEDEANELAEEVKVLEDDILIVLAEKVAVKASE